MCLTRQPPREPDDSDALDDIIDAAGSFIVGDDGESADGESGRSACGEACREACGEGGDSSGSETNDGGDATVCK